MCVCMYILTYVFCTEFSYFVKSFIEAKYLIYKVFNFYVLFIQSTLNTHKWEM